MKIALKELRGSLVWLKIIERKPLCEKGQVGSVLAECNELVAIFVSSVKTAESAAR